MSTPDENSTNHSFSWQEPIEAIRPLEPHNNGASPGFEPDYLSQNISTQSFQDLSAPRSSALDYLHNMSTPYATNWSIFENYNLLPRFDLHMMNENPELDNRIRMNSTSSSASSLSYNMAENQANCFISSLSEVSEPQIGYNEFYQPSPQSSQEITHAPNYHDRVILHPTPILPEQAHSIDLGLSSLGSFNGYYKPYLANFPSNFTTKVPNDCSNRPYKCEQCGSSFSRNHDLKRHSRIHLEVKPFPCSCCDKAFARKDALKRHLLVKGCSPSKRGTTRGSSQNERQKSAHNTTTTARKRAVGHIRTSSSSSSVPHYSKTNNTEASEPFRDIKLQNIKCTVPNFL